MRISDWSSDVCSSDLNQSARFGRWNGRPPRQQAILPILEQLMAEQDTRNPAEIEQEIERTQDEMRSEEHTSELQSLMRISYAVCCSKKYTPQNTQSHLSNHNFSTNKTELNTYI